MSELNIKDKEARKKYFADRKRIHNKGSYGDSFLLSCQLLAELHKTGKSYFLTYSMNYKQWLVCNQLMYDKFVDVFELEIIFYPKPIS